MAKFFIITIAYCLWFLTTHVKSQSVIRSIVDFGAISGGTVDASGAFARAWNIMCNDNRGSILDIPIGMAFMSQPVSFEGPCTASSITFRIEGTIVAPTKQFFKMDAHNTWFNFHAVNNLIISGNGKFDGRGDDWWNCRNSAECEKNPTALGFHNCNNLQLIDFTSFHSPRNHLTINKCDGPFINNVNLQAIENSPNTDGIDISDSTNVNITSATIQTGDDCIAINGGSSGIFITGVNCGLGHGISVGSLGRNGANDIVSNIHVKQSTLTSTKYGVRIKTVPGGKGSATDISFSDITFINVHQPVWINQFYCNNGQESCPEAGSAVALSGIKYTNLQGTTSTEQGSINFNCSRIAPCKDITVNGKINITPTGSAKAVGYSCQNVLSGTTVPNTSPLVTLPCPPRLVVSGRGRKWLQ